MGKTDSQIASRRIISGEVEFPADDPVYKTHFPDNPVVPGSLASGFLQSQVEAAFGKIFRIRKVSFVEFMPPGVYCWDAVVEIDKVNVRLFRPDPDFSLHVKAVFQLEDNDEV
jgi:3-hydroxymyristoyl/3-hydroxydecanoyl-(acyl carrier protein) dehydratase